MYLDLEKIIYFDLDLYLFYRVPTFFNIYILRNNLREYI